MKNFLSLLMLLWLVDSVWAQTQIIEFEGATFNPNLHTIEGKKFYRADDPEVVRLIQKANVTVQWSGSGATLFAFAPGRESYWTAGSKKATVNKVEIEAPGQLAVANGASYIEPQGLFYALATKGSPTDSGFALFPVITEIAQSGEGFLLRSAIKAKPQASSEDNFTTLSIDGFSWDGPAEAFWVGDTSFQVKSGADKGAPLEIEITSPPFFASKLAGATLLQETKIASIPNFPNAAQAAEVELKNIEANLSEGVPMLVLEFDSGTKAHYSVDPQSGDLKIYLPKTTTQCQFSGSGEWKGVSLDTYSTSLYNLTEISIPSDGDKFEFVTIEDSPTSIGLLRGPASSLEAIKEVGSVETSGWANVRGTIVLDPGHGGSDPGCINRYLGTREADVTLKICTHLAEILRSQGWKVVMTRESDRDVTYAGSPDTMELEARSDVANQIGADLFMSVHCNASVNPDSQGSSIHWWKPEDYAFAQAIEPVLGYSIGLGQQGLIRNRFVVLRHAQMPSILVETAFLSNYTEGAKLSDPQFQKVIAQQLAGGLANYMRGAYASRGVEHPSD